MLTVFNKFPNRFKGHMPKSMPLPAAAWINKPNDIVHLPVCRPDKAEPGQASPPGGGI